MKSIAVTAVSEKITIGKKISQRLNLPYLSLDETKDCPYAFLIMVTHDYIGLKQLGSKKIFFIDFSSKQLGYRRHGASLRNELLGKAVGVKPKDHPRIVDATAGLGRDSFILASLGFEMTLLERSPLLFLLLQDALMRGSKIVELQAIMSRMHLIEANAIHWLKNKPSIDIVYLDPMFPMKNKTALPRKEMALLQDLIGPDQDSESLLESALACASYRVVVKRPRLAEYIANNRPNFSLIGRSSRFDIYMV